MEYLLSFVKRDKQLPVARVGKKDKSRPYFMRQQKALTDCNKPCFSRPLRKNKKSL